jgi:[lysine-biosynthesis-protein LysW]---L-2-aminoadipate ligase
MRVAMLYSRIRVEERLLIEELQRRCVEHELIDVRECVWDVDEPGNLASFDVVIERCISQTQALAAVRIFERWGVPCVNPSRVIDLCGDKLSTTLALASAGVPQPRVKVAVEGAAALRAVEAMGYPAVLKPTVGSWGRLLARVHDREAAEAVIEHKETLGGPQHGVFYVQEYVNKPGRDLRVFMVGGEPIAAIERRSEHWITNTARGGKADRFVVDGALADVCRRTAGVIGGESVAGGGILAIDVLEDPTRGYLVSEVNHTMEFRNSIQPTGVDIPGRMIEYVLDVGRRRAGSTVEVKSVMAGSRQ